MSFRTSADLVLKVLDNLGVLPAGQVPGPEDTADVQAALPSVIEKLAGEEIVFVADIEQIPGAWFLPLASIVAYDLMEEFGVTGDDAAVLTAKNQTARSALKAMNRGKPTYQQAGGLYV